MCIFDEDWTQLYSPEERDRMGRFREERKIEEISRALVLARLRCCGAEELIDRLGNHWGRSDSAALIRHLEFAKLDRRQCRQLSKKLLSLLVSSEKWHSSDKIHAENLVRRLSRRLPCSLAAPLISPCIQSPRGSRRRIAFELLSKHGFDQVIGAILLDTYQIMYDRKALEVLARRPEGIPDSQVPTVLAELQDQYWRARIFQSLVITRRNIALASADVYPVEFIWGAARAKDQGSLAKMTELLRQRPHDLDVMSIYVWAMGRLSANHELDAIGEAFESLLNERADLACA